jgi:PhoPQ-activated pathogenicity-related protein
MVIDLLNIERSFIHHWEAYGFYAPAVQDYEAMGIMNWQGTKEYRNLMKIEEPFEYRDRLTMPKFIINASGDQFFLPDSSQFYFKDLPGTKYLRYVPNADHSLKDTDAVETLVACYDSILKHTPLPRFSWVDEPDGTIRAKAVDKPESVKLWQATNPGARDFRVETLGKVWTSTELTDSGGGTYVGAVSKPEKGWTAYFVELAFRPDGTVAPFKFTTHVRVIPDVLPYKFQPKPSPVSDKPAASSAAGGAR